MAKPRLRVHRASTGFSSRDRSIHGPTHQAHAVRLAVEGGGQVKAELVAFARAPGSRIRARSRSRRTPSITTRSPTASAVSSHDRRASGALAILFQMDCRAGRRINPHSTSLIFQIFVFLHVPPDGAPKFSDLPRQIQTRVGVELHEEHHL